MKGKKKKIQWNSQDKREKNSVSQKPINFAKCVFGSCIKVSMWWKIHFFSLFLFSIDVGNVNICDGLKHSFIAFKNLGFLADVAG